MNTCEEKETIRRAVRGDTRALSVLLRENYAFLLKYLLKITMNPGLAEDLTQETMIRCIERITTYDGRSKFSSWMITIGTNLYIDELRRKKRERRLWEQAQGVRSIQWQAATAAADDAWMAAMEALSRLSHALRVPVILKHYYGYSYEEIAGIMGIAEGTVKSRVHHGLRRLRKELQRDGAE